MKNPKHEHNKNDDWFYVTMVILGLIAVFFIIGKNIYKAGQENGYKKAFEFENSLQNNKPDFKSPYYKYLEKNKEI